MAIEAVSSTIPKLTYMRTPLYKMTFSISTIRRWVEEVCEGRTLNLFAGETCLNIAEVRNDIRDDMPADYHEDALKFVREWEGKDFDTVLLDPPYSYRKSMEMYDGAVSSPFNALKDALPQVLSPNGIVICFGYHSVNMGRSRGFEQEEILLMSHGGAIHDTIAVVERMAA